MSLFEAHEYVAWAASEAPDISTIVTRLNAAWQEPEHYNILTSACRIMLLPMTNDGGK
jgi:hypothetical protein